MRSASDIPDDRVVVGPASIDGGIAAFEAPGRDGIRPTAVLAMSDAMAIGVDARRARPAACPSRATSASSASTTSTSPSTWTLR